MKLNVVMSTYNGSFDTRRAIESFLKLPMQNKTLYIVDDCSTDDTRENLNHYLHAENIKIYFREKNCGASANRNLILSQLPKDEWILNLDQDDVLLKNDLIEIEQIKNMNNVGAVYFDNQIIKNKILENEHKWYKPLFQYLSRHSSWLLFLFYPPRIGATVYKTRVLQSIGGFGTTRFGGEDWEIFYNLLNSGYRLRYIKKDLMCRSESGNNTSIQDRLSRQSNFKQLCLRKSKSRFLNLIIILIFWYRKKRSARYEE